MSGIEQQISFLENMLDLLEREDIVYDIFDGQQQEGEFDHDEE